jgi:MFS transporter, MFS domain-containing protein family, molybdate-anion transporter
MWVPTLLELIQGVHDSLPTGLVFSAFMLSMSAGGMLFTLLNPVIPGGSKTICSAVYLLSALAMAVPISHFEFWIVFISFLLLESMLGMFNSCGATLRSIYYPEQMQSSIMSIFRLPLNLLVVIGTVLTNNSKSRSDMQQVYFYVAGMHLIAFLLQISLNFFPVPRHLLAEKKAS